MAYVGNIVAFIQNRIEFNDNGFNVFNYTDPPDLTMNQLVSFIEKKINIQLSSFKIPFFLGMFIGYFFDLIAKITRNKFPISSVRIKKFCATTQFDASKAHASFCSPSYIRGGFIINT